MNPFGAIGYGLSAVAFALLTLLLLTAWRGPGGRLIAATAITFIWSAGLAVQAWLAPLPLIVVYVLEVARDAAWLVLLTGLAASAIPTVLRIGVHGAWVALLAAGIILDIGDRAGRLADGAGWLLPYAGLLTSLLGFVLIEQLYRNAAAAARTALKPLVIGVGVIFAFDLFLYSQAFLLRGLDPDLWSARGFVYAFIVPLLAIAARRNPDWALRIFVSRQAVFFTTSFLAIGAYLFLMAAGGLYLSAIGATWGRIAQFVFFAGAGIVLLAVISSEDLRRRLKVFIGKHFYQNKYDYRIEWLRFIGTLSSSEDVDIHRTALHAVAQILGSPGGVLFLPDDGRRRFVARAAWPMRLADVPDVRDIEAGNELPTFMERRRWIIDLKEYRRSREIYQNIELPGWLLGDERWRIVSPMFQGESMTGFFLLYAPTQGFELTYEDRDLLLTVGRHVATHIAQHEADRRLSEARQFEAYNRLTAFMMHDLKNSIAQLQLVVANAARHKQNPEFVDDAISTIENTAGRMGRLLEQLKGGVDAPVAAAVGLRGVLEAALDRCAGRSPVPRLVGEAGVTVMADAERLTTLFEHVIRNAQDATPPTGSVVVEVARVDSEVLVTVVDSGTGMTGEFIRERLFRPFDSTKGSKGMGIGAYQAREYVRQLGGDVEVLSMPGQGTRFRVTLPVVAVQDTGMTPVPA